MPQWTVLARRPNLTIAGELTGVGIDVTLRHNEVGSWSLNPPREGTPAGWPAPYCGVVFLRDGRVVASGMVDEETYTFSTESGSDDAGPGRYQLTGDTDLGRLAYRTVFPSTENLWEDQQQNYYVHPAQPANAEGVLRRLVDRQAGSNARGTRRVPGLRSFTTAQLGTNVTVRERFTPLLEAMRTIAGDGGGLAFDVIDTLGGNLDLQIWQPRDLSQRAQFGIELGNIIDLTVQRVAATGNAALIAGGGELDNRSLRSFIDGNVTGLNRREAFIDQRQVGEQGSTQQDRDEQEEEYRKAGEEALAEGREQTAVSATIFDTDLVQWHRDYGVGDLVAVQTPWGEVTDLVREVRITVDEHGVEDIVSTIGTTEASHEDPLAKTVRDMQRRINQLERSQ